MFRPGWIYSSTFWSLRKFVMFNWARYTSVASLLSDWLARRTAYYYISCAIRLAYRDVFAIRYRWCYIVCAVRFHRGANLGAKYDLQTKTLGPRAAQLSTDLDALRRHPFPLAHVGSITRLSPAPA